MNDIIIEKWLEREVAKACGYIPISEFLNDHENIEEVFVLGSEGEYLALTNQERLIYVSHWYGNSDNISVPNVAKTAESIIGCNAKMGDAFKDVLWELLDKYHDFPFLKLSEKLRVKIAQLIGYKRKEVMPTNTKPSDIKPNIEYVYFLTADNGLTKIGKTTRLDERIHHFTTKLPYELTETLVLETNNCTVLETELHNKFVNKRIRGEWFNLTREDISWIRDKYLKEKEHGYS